MQKQSLRENVKVEISTERFLLRTLGESDVSARYLGWLGDTEAKKFITTAVATPGLADLTQYVRERCGRDDVLFLGIFEKSSGTHIGNIKYEPINPVEGYAVMGVLIGEPAYRGKGVTGEILRASAAWLKQHRHIKQILLGVGKDNGAAIRAYEKVGFIVAATPYLPQPMSGTITMVWYL